MQNKLELYRRVVPLAGLGIFERDLENSTIYWNPVIREMLEVPDDFSPVLEESISFYSDPQAIRNLIDQAIASGLPETAELELFTAKNNHKWIKIRIQADCENGRCLRLYGTMEDITDHVSLKNKLEEREKRFTNAFDHAPIGMALVSLRGEWIKVNLSLCHLLGYTEQGFLKRTFQDFTYPEDLDKDLSLLKQLVEGTIPSYSMEKRYYHADGRLIWALLNVSLVRDESAVPLYFVSQIKDISEHKRNMETIRSQNERLLNFAHIVSHNLRSHTGNIRMLTDLIVEEQDQAEKDSLVQMLNMNTGNLLETLDHLNEVVKVHDNGQIGRKALKLSAEVKRVLDILSASIRQSGAQITTDISEELTVDFSPAYLESILINLIGNSLKYKHPDRLPEILLQAAQTDGHVILQIKDNGLGIDLSLHGHKLFGMYKTFHKHPDARGMGLFLVKNEVEAMGGKIRAESQPGQGTTFIIEFN
ncbi:PAS domain S-box protein [Mucilaginibacter angelicae]|uniref:histidine kinase n=1 Tax=Mucilaginibacter angelicae TaxID=869718 RepID=A0ABV6LFF0_9SPHI